MTTTSEVALLTAAGLHAGFQLTVSTLVYPALFRAQEWHTAHEAHRRAITPVVALVYGAVLCAAVFVLVDGVIDPAVVVALAGVALAFGATALVAAPLHGRLAHGRDAELVRRLRRADLIRTAGAFLALAGAAVAATTS